MLFRNSDQVGGSRGIKRPATELQKLTIYPATQEQRLEIIKQTKDYTKDGRLTYWVLVPEHDKRTLDILSCCRTYRRDASILHANSDTPAQGFGYAIGTVVTPKKHRRQGYANQMLTLLGRGHHALAPNVYPDPGVIIDIPPSVYPGAFSVLYSDVGAYYERCGPAHGEIGWKVQNPISTIWQLSEAHPVLSNQSGLSPEVQLLSQEEVTTLLSSDVPDWETLPRTPDTTYVSFSPSAVPNLHLMTRSTIHPLHNKSSDVFWGAKMTSNGHFITWAFDYSSPLTLVITRINTDSSTLPILLLAALKAGEAQRCEQAEVWNLPEELLEEARRIGGKTHERALHLPAIRWYGPEPAEKVVWMRNEYYSWT
ncbi:hypothetical protein OPQ81_002572 [Rhizoctonia solani]|nr:hypothetical protein OPQ81_002572 [Rhizoctonia solani]